jgi:hypothetical protein
VLVNLNVVEIIGYLASALVVASFAMKSVVRLRIVSLIGSVVFVVYGVMLGSIPLIITNAAAAALNLWNLRREFRADRDLGAVPIAADAPFLLDFLHSHRDDIARFHPRFSEPADGDFVRLLNRDGLPAGAIIGTPDGSTLRIKLDYVMQAYRDSRIGGWLYGAGAKTFTDAGFTQLLVQPESEALRTYLLKLGFGESAQGLQLQLRP